MTAAVTEPLALPAVVGGWSEPTCWGLGVRGLHDRWWSISRIQPVRRGVRVAEKGPELYLLLEPDELLLFDPAPIVKRLSWLKPEVMRVRVVDVAPVDSVERVAADAAGNLKAIQRTYRAPTLGTRRPLLTPDPRIAVLWANASARREGLRAAFAACGRDNVAVGETSGRIFDAADRASVEEFLGALIRAWKTVAGALDGVYEFQPGVWLHESVTMAPGIRFIGPLWVGAGQRLRKSHLLVGPAIVPDAPGAEPSVRPVDWENLLDPALRLRPSLPGRPGWSVVKRAFDIAFAAAVLLATAPVYPLVMLMIWREDGWPAFFAHTRQTRGGRNFPCYKFRTMCKDAEKMKAVLAAKNQADGPQFFIEDDPRLLRIGKTLRRFQLDELPQFWNVLRGEMSVVGPRPSPDKENQYCPAWREARLSVRPGVTGLWQIRRTRAPETDFQEWIRFDLEYVQNQSWRLDLWIIAQTILKVFRG